MWTPPTFGPDNSQEVKKVNRSKILTLSILALCAVGLFLPWMNVSTSTLSQEVSAINYGYHYVMATGSLTAPLALISILGIAVAAISFKASKRVLLLSLIGGLLIVGGVVASFLYTANQAMAQVSTSANYSVDVGLEYGAGLELLFAVVLMVTGVFARRLEPISP